MSENRFTWAVSGEPRAAFSLGLVFGILAGAAVIFLVGHVASHYALDR